MTHFFEVDIATKYGIEAAIILHDLFYWIVKNKANDVNYYDGRYWDYNSTAALKELYPYMKEYTITSTLKKLKEKGLILTGCFNKLPFDRTTWYTLTDDGLALFKGKEIDVLKTGNALFENEVFDTQEIKEPIPIVKVLSNESTNISDLQQSMFLEDKDIQSNKDIVSTKNSKSTTKQKKIDLKNKIIHLIDEYTDNDGLRKSLYDFVEMREKQKKPVPTEHAMELLLKSLTNLCGNDTKRKTATVDKAIMKCWLSFYPLKQEDLMSMEERQTDLDDIF